jgi:hypothetical protein
MPKGPQGQKRPADAIGAAIMVAKIATGEILDSVSVAPKRAKGGKIGGAARAKTLGADARKSIAKKASAARWHKTDTDPQN